MKSKLLFNEAAQEKIVAAIKEAESKTSGEIRVHIESYCKGDVLDRAAAVFAKLEMHKTEQRSGVLFYLATEDRKFAILGDVGINQKVPADFWTNIKDQMANKFRNGEFAEGLANGILMAGEQLQKHFPKSADNPNELSDDISWGSDKLV